MPTYLLISFDEKVDFPNFWPPTVWLPSQNKLKMSKIRAALDCTFLLRTDQSLNDAHSWYSIAYRLQRFDVRGVAKGEATGAKASP